MILDLTDAYDQIKGPLQQVAPKLAASSQPEAARVVLVHRSQLSTVWDTIDVVKRTVTLLTIGALVLVAAGLALAVDRWRALARAAWMVTATGAVLVFAVLFVAGCRYGGRSPTACSPTRLSRAAGHHQPAGRADDPGRGRGGARRGSPCALHRSCRSPRVASGRATGTVVGGRHAPARR